MLNKLRDVTVANGRSPHEKRYSLRVVLRDDQSRHYGRVHQQSSGKLCDFAPTFDFRRRLLSVHDGHRQQDFENVGGVGECETPRFSCCVPHVNREFCAQALIGVTDGFYGNAQRGERRLVDCDFLLE